MGIKDDMEDVQEAVINELITENGITNTLADGQVTPAKLDRAYLESTGGSVSGNLGIGMTPDIAVRFSVNGAIGPTNGSAGSPTHTFYSDADTGMYRAGANTLGFSTDGSERIRIQSNGTIKISNSSTPSTPSGGGVLYVQNGALKFRGSSGTITTIANA